VRFIDVLFNPTDTEKEEYAYGWYFAPKHSLELWSRGMLPTILYADAAFMIRMEGQLFCVGSSFCRMHTIHIPIYLYLLQ
jgi:hypothetical protein